MYTILGNLDFILQALGNQPWNLKRPQQLDLWFRMTIWHQCEYWKEGTKSGVRKSSWVHYFNLEKKWQDWTEEVRVGMERRRWLQEITGGKADRLWQLIRFYQLGYQEDGGVRNNVQISGLSKRLNGNSTYVLWWGDIGKRPVCGERLWCELEISSR